MLQQLDLWGCARRRCQSVALEIFLVVAREVDRVTSRAVQLAGCLRSRTIVQASWRSAERGYPLPNSAVASERPCANRSRLDQQKKLQTKIHQDQSPTAAPACSELSQ